MAKKTINVGVEGNDGTGDSIRVSFQKTNDNFTELYALYDPSGKIRFTSLADAPSSYSSNQLIMASTSGEALTARTIVASGDITIDTSDNGQITFSVTNALSNDSTPTLGNPLNAMLYGMGNVPMPTASVLNDYNNTHASLNSLDSFVVPKLYVDQQIATADQLSELKDVTLSTLGTGNLLSFDQGTPIVISTATITSGTATLTFADQGSTPFATGTTILVSGVTPTTYNGVYIVTGGSSTTVTYANTSTLPGTGGSVRKQVWNNVASNITITKKFLTQTGTGSDSVEPSWQTLIDNDIPSVLTGKTYNGLTLTSLAATGWKISGGVTPVEVSFTGGAAYTIIGTDNTNITLPAITGELALTTQQFYLGSTAIAINRTIGVISLTGITSIDGYSGSLIGGNSTTLLGALPYQSNTNTTSLLSPNTTITKKYLNQTGNGTNGAVPSWDQIDQLTTITTAIVSSGTGGVGYVTTAGGYVEQLTSKATTVELNKPTGLIYTFNDVLNTATTVSFTLTNSTISSTDLIIIQHVSGGNQFDYVVSAIAGSGSATVYLKNISSGNLSEHLYLRFAVIKSVGSPP